MRHLEKMEEFCFETVLSTDRNLKLLQQAKGKGCFIRCYYILTADPLINVYRVKSRVAAGGHDVPEGMYPTESSRSEKINTFTTNVRIGILRIFKL